jgi:hypothetical protein
MSRSSGSYPVAGCAASPFRLCGTLQVRDEIMQRLCPATDGQPRYDHIDEAWDAGHADRVNQQQPEGPGADHRQERCQSPAHGRSIGAQSVEFSLCDGCGLNAARDVVGCIRPGLEAILSFDEVSGMRRRGSVCDRGVAGCDFGSFVAADVEEVVDAFENPLDRLRQDIQGRGGYGFVVLVAGVAVSIEAPGSDPLDQGAADEHDDSQLGCPTSSRARPERFCESASLPRRGSSG